MSVTLCGRCCISNSAIDSGFARKRFSPRLLRRIPQYAIWDNHDYGPEPTDKRLKNKEQTLEAFKMFWPNPAYGEADNPGVYFKFRRGDVDFFMTDDRYNRDPNNAPEDGRKSYLGAKQFAVCILSICSGG